MPENLPTTSRSIAVRPDQPGEVHETLIPVPEPGPDDVAVKVIRVGVCGTDREIIHGYLGTPPDGTDELVIGHEVLGRVIATGPDVTDLAPGDLVSATVRRPDGCPACQAGQPDMCLWHQYEERGIVGQHGFMTEYFVEQRPYIVPVPESLEHVGVLVEPLTVVEKALRQADLIQERMTYWRAETAVVLGAGPIGILGTLLLRAGCRRHHRRPHAQAEPGCEHRRSVRCELRVDRGGITGGTLPAARQHRPHPGELGRQLPGL